MFNKIGKAFICSGFAAIYMIGRITIEKRIKREWKNDQKI